MLTISVVLLISIVIFMVAMYFNFKDLNQKMSEKKVNSNNNVDLNNINLLQEDTVNLKKELNSLKEEILFLKNEINDIDILRIKADMSFFKQEILNEFKFKEENYSVKTPLLFNDGLVSNSMEINSVVTKFGRNRDKARSGIPSVQEQVLKNSFLLNNCSL